MRWDPIAGVVRGYNVTAAMVFDRTVGTAANSNDGSLGHLGKGVRWYIVDASTLFSSTTTPGHGVETIEWTTYRWSDGKLLRRELKPPPSEEA